MNIEEKLKSYSDVFSIDDEMYLTENHSDDILCMKPTKYDITIACVCTTGFLEGEISLLPFKSVGQSLLVMLPEQVVQISKKSEDFKCFFIIMTRQFIDKITLAENFSTFMTIRSNPCIPISPQVFDGIDKFYKMTKSVLLNTEEGFNKKAIVNHLTIAFFYGLGFYIHKRNIEQHPTRNDIIRDDFLRLLQLNFKKEHSVDFYAKKMFYSTKYLSMVIKNATGKSPSQWIADHIVLEAKTLLKDTDMTVQQISSVLNFPSQSFFGKYFKLRTGLSPLEYKKNQQ